MNQLKSRFSIRISRRLTNQALVSACCSAVLLAAAAETTGGAEIATTAINALGVDLLAHGSAPDVNALLSPYSIQNAMVMTFAGADGDTRIQMAKVLHYPADETDLHSSLAALRRALADVQKRTAELAQESKKRGGPSDPVTLTVANRLFGQGEGYQFRPPFLALLKNTYEAPLDLMDFIHDAAGATRTINGWVEQQTHDRIRDLIPLGALDESTRLVLVNAIYLKAPWANEFSARATKPEPFHVKGGAEVNVPTMNLQSHLAYAARDGFQVVAVPYSGGDVQFLILLPDKADGLAVLERRVTAEVLAANRNPATTNVNLHLPKFKFESPVLKLRPVLESLGMKSAFDVPKGSANFDRMAPRKADDYLAISEIFHRTFIALDEKGTEAAATTAVSMVAPTAVRIRTEPIEVRVDRPFLFAIQHRPSGACLFLGRVTDPR